MHDYVAAGLHVRSEIELPGMHPLEGPVSAVEVTIRWGDVPLQLAEAGHSGPTWQMADRLFLLQIPNVARFLVSGGAQITVAPEGLTAPADIAAFLTGTVFGILLHQRGQVVLHASAIQVGSVAMLFCGPSGIGKSTLAAALNARGYPLICDDFSVLRITDGCRPAVLPDGRQLKLWADAAAKLRFTPGAHVRSRINKHFVEPGLIARKAVALAAIYVLAEARPPRRPGIEPRNIVDATLAVRRNAYRPHLAERMDQRTLYFEAAVRLAGSAGVYALQRPLDFAEMDTVIGWLESHWTAQGLLRAA